MVTNHWFRQSIGVLVLCLVSWLLLGCSNGAALLNDPAVTGSPSSDINSSASTTPEPGNTIEESLVEATQKPLPDATRSPTPPAERSSTNVPPVLTGKWAVGLVPGTETQGPDTATAIEFFKDGTIVVYGYHSDPSFESGEAYKIIVHDEAERKLEVKLLGPGQPSTFWPDYDTGINEILYDLPSDETLILTDSFDTDTVWHRVESGQSGPVATLEDGIKGEWTDIHPGHEVELSIAFLDAGWALWGFDTASDNTLYQYSVTSDNKLEFYTPDRVTDVGVVEAIIPSDDTLILSRPNNESHVPLPQIMERTAEDVPTIEQVNERNIVGKWTLPGDAYPVIEFFENGTSITQQTDGSDAVVGEYVIQPGSDYAELAFTNWFNYRDEILGAIFVGNELVLFFPDQAEFGAIVFERLQ